MVVVVVVTSRTVHIPQYGRHQYLAILIVILRLTAAPFWLQVAADQVALSTSSIPVAPPSSNQSNDTGRSTGSDAHDPQFSGRLTQEASAATPLGESELHEARLQPLRKSRASRSVVEAMLFNDRRASSSYSQRWRSSAAG